MKEPLFIIHKVLLYFFKIYNFLIILNIFFLNRLILIYITDSKIKKERWDWFKNNI